MSDSGLRQLVRTIMALDDEVADLVAARRDAMADGKARGYDPRVVRNLIRRQRMAPEDRAAADDLLAQYEAELGIGSPDAPPVADALPGRRREAFVAPANATSEERLRGYISRVMELRGERKETGEVIRIELRKARADGFDPRKITEACMWLERCDKDGRERMLAGEELFQIYREIGEGPAPVPMIAGDSKLVAMFAGAPPQQTKTVSLKQKQCGDAMALAMAARMNRGRA